MKKIIITLLALLGIGGVYLGTERAEPPVELPVSIESRLEGKPASEKARIKSAEIVKHDYSQPYTDARYGIRVEIQSINEIEGGVEVFARAWKDGKQLGFGKDGTVDIERFRIYNPPVLVDDLNGEIERIVVDEAKGTSRVRKLREDPREALFQDLADTMQKVGLDGKNIVKGKVGNTTSTFHPDAGSGSTTVDGTAYSQAAVELDWSARRAGTGGGVFKTSANETTFGDYDNGSSIGYLYRYIATFDTSPIDSDTVDSAVFSIYVTTLNDGSRTGGLIQSSPASNNDLVAGDFDAPTEDGYTEGASRVLVDGTGAYFDWTLDATGLGFIDTGGITKLGLRDAADLDDSDPGTTGSGFTINAYHADQTGTANDPKLVVVHSAAAAEEEPEEDFIIIFE